jgi:hypothetical protein
MSDQRPSKERVLLPLTCELHLHVGYGTSEDVSCPWCERERLQRERDEYRECAKLQADGAWRRVTAEPQPAASKELLRAAKALSDQFQTGYQAAASYYGTELMALRNAITACESVAALEPQPVSALIAKVNARIPSSVTPATRIEIHPSEWISLTDEIERLTRVVEDASAAMNVAGAAGYDSPADCIRELCRIIQQRPAPEPRAVSCPQLDLERYTPLNFNGLLSDYNTLDSGVPFLTIAQRGAENGEIDVGAAEAGALYTWLGKVLSQPSPEPAAKQCRLGGECGYLDGKGSCLRCGEPHPNEPPAVQSPFEERARAWDAVARKLEEVNPHTFEARKSGLQCALDQIERMRTPQPQRADDRAVAKLIRIAGECAECHGKRCSDCADVWAVIDQCRSSQPPGECLHCEWPAGTRVEVEYEDGEPGEPGVIVKNPEIRVRFVEDGAMEVVFPASRLRRATATKCEGQS